MVVGTSPACWGSRCVEHMSDLKIRVETEEWIFEEYFEA